MKIKIRLHYSTNIEEKILIHQDDKVLVQEVCQYLETKFHIKSPALFIDGFKLIMDEQLSRLVVDEIIDAIEGQVSSFKKVKQNESQKQIIAKPIVAPKVLQLIQSTSESESEDVKIKAKPNQKQALHQRNIIKPGQKSNLKKSQQQIQESDSSKTPDKQKQNEQQSIMKKMVQPKIQQTWTAKTKTQEKIQAKIKEVTSSDDSSSSEILPKPNQQNKLLLSIKSPEIEIKEKQLEWRKTFQQSSQKSEINKKIDGVQPQIKKAVSINLPEFFKITVQQLDQNAQLLLVGDQIQFKYVYLDVSKFQPAISSITKGKIIENNNETKKLKIFANNQELLLAYTEFKEIEIDIANLPQERKDIYYTINGIKKQIDQIVPQQEQIQISQGNKIDIEQNDKTIQKEELLKKKSEIDPHNIGQQINYYFSDKNYLKDDYILQHTAQHPEKYMLIKLLLNFPRVKKIVSNEQILFDIIDIQKKILHWSDINFEMKQQEDGQWLIRKKLKNQ